MSNKASLRFIQVPQKRRINFQGINLNPVNDEPVGHTPEKKGEPTLGEKILSNNPLLKALAEKFTVEVIGVKRILEEERRYSKNEAVAQISQRLGFNKAQSEKVFIGMVDKGAVEAINPTGYYFLAGSTPF